MNTVRLGNYIFQVTSYDVYVRKHLIFIQVFAKSDEVDHEISEISFELYCNTRKHTISGDLFAAEFMPINNAAISHYMDMLRITGKTDVDWNDELGRNVEYEIILQIEDEQ